MFASTKSDGSSIKPKTLKEETQKKLINEEYDVDSAFFEENQEKEFSEYYFMDDNILKNYPEKSEEEKQLNLDECTKLEMFL